MKCGKYLLEFNYKINKLIFQQRQIFTNAVYPPLNNASDRNISVIFITDLWMTDIAGKLLSVKYINNKKTIDGITFGIIKKERTDLKKGRMIDNIKT